ncbi:MAG: serine/threonine protein phosphatase [Deltaproteobacteria bacterium]|nr:serine/threonine protein phosphatase [Deltaproteobacteria bacterium]
MTEKESVFIIGDVHGCLEILKRLMNKIDWQPDRDRLIFLGDYVDRGEDPKGVVDYLLQLRDAAPDIRFLMGNHESLFMNYLEGHCDESLFLRNGGDRTLASYKEGGDINVPPEHLSFFESLQSMIELKEHYVVHAGLVPGIDMKFQRKNDKMWIRDPFIYSNYDFGKRVIFGHTPFVEPLVMDNKIGLDTGAVFGNKLTCLELPDMIFHSVEA